MKTRYLIPLVFLLSLSVLSAPVLVYGRGFSPNYNATFTGDINGGGPVQIDKPVKNRITYIASDARINNYPLTFSDIFEGFAGAHSGYLSMARKSVAATSIEIRYTWGPDDDGLFYQLHGFGMFTQSGAVFRINSDGEYTISKSGKSTDWAWISVWRGEPSFTIDGTPLSI